MVLIPGSFNWRPYLKKPNTSFAPVSCFKHVALAASWEKLTDGVFVEVRSPDCKTCCTVVPCRYWVATIVKTAGYYGLLQYVCSNSKNEGKWVNLLTDPHIHPIGWCARNRKPLVPPVYIEEQFINIESCKRHLLELLRGATTLPPDFESKIEENSAIGIRKGMKLEVVDKNMISVVREAIVEEVVGGRLHVKYVESEIENEDFWCHERSPLIHPVGWAQAVRHALKARPEYARQSLKKVLSVKFDTNDTMWGALLPFLPVYNPVEKLQFKAGMKLEAIDPLNLSTICVATVTEVLRNHYLMIGIDGMMNKNRTDCFCYHASSPSIFPVGFCDSHGIELSPPRGYKGEFKWSEYLKKTKSDPAPATLFHREIPDHGFKVGRYLEAVDLMEPRLICVAYVTQVVGRLLRIHFEGWEDDYDQWCDCESPDLFPAGWCEVVKYKLEPPRSDESEYKKQKKTRKKTFQSGVSFKGKRRTKGKKIEESQSAMIVTSRQRKAAMKNSVSAPSRSNTSIDDSSSSSFASRNADDD